MQGSALFITGGNYVFLFLRHNDYPWQVYKQVGNHLSRWNLYDDMSGKLHTDIPKIRKGMMGGVVSVSFFKG